MSNEDIDLDVIMKEIEATTPPEGAQEPQPQEFAVVKRTADDIDDRRQRAWALRQRGKTYREIGAELDVSIGTVKRDLDIARRSQREAIEFHDREDYLASLNAQYEDLKREAWNLMRGADKETKLKALTQIRLTIDAQRKALQDTGVVRKEQQVQETVQIGLVAKWADSDIKQAASALIGSQLNLHLESPSPDIEDAEIVDDVENENEDREEE